MDRLSGFPHNYRMDPLDGVAAFVRVAEAASFSAAARRLGLSKSAISAHVQRLEQRLGVRLLQRSTRRVALTEAGEAYFRHALRILADAEAAEREAAALHHEPSGRLRISVPDMFGWMHIAPALPAFLARYPRLAIDLSLSARHVDLIEDRLDCAIRIGTPPSNSPLVVRALAPSRLVVCAARSWLAANQAPETPQALAGLPCLRFSPMPWGEEWRFQPPGGDLVRVPVSGPFASDSAEALRAMALAGTGLALLPIWAIAEELRSATLRTLLPDYPPPPSTIAAVYPSNRLMSARVKLFVEHLVRHFGQPPYWEHDIVAGVPPRPFD